MSDDSTWHSTDMALRREELADLRTVEQEAAAAEREKADLEAKVVDGEDVDPASLVVAEEKGRLARLRLVGVRRRHEKAREEARQTRLRELHKEVSDLAAVNADVLHEARQRLVKAVADLTTFTQTHNDRLARLRAEVDMVLNESDVESDVVIVPGSRGSVRVDEQSVEPCNLTNLIAGAIHDGIGGDVRKLDNQNHHFQSAVQFIARYAR